MAESDDHYGALGELYERTRHIPTGLPERATFLSATFLSALPDLRGKSVLDVACGTGFHPREFRRLGAAAVVGVDSSAEMLGYARDVERRAPLGIDCHRHDATTLPVLGVFDLVTAVWLLGYAEDEAALDLMIGNLRANLAPGGTPAVLVPNPDADWNLLADHGRYGYRVTRTGPPGVRRPVAVHLLGDPPFELDSFVWSDRPERPAPRPRVPHHATTTASPPSGRTWGRGAAPPYFRQQNRRFHSSPKPVARSSDLRVVGRGRPCPT